MANVIIIDRADGEISVLYPIGTYVLEEEVQKFVSSANSSWLPLVSYEVRDSNILPTNRRWRKAWRYKNSNLTINTPAARNIRKSELLKERDTRLEKVRKRRATAEEDNNNSEVNQLKTRAIALRNLDSTIDSQLSSVLLSNLELFVPTEFSVED